MQARLAVVGFCLAAVLAGCQKSSPQPEAEPATGETVAETSADPAPAAAATPSGLQAKDGTAVPLVAFEIASVPVSQQALGALPFFSLPEGYAPRNRPKQRAYARFPFRLGDGVHWVEGPSWSATIDIAGDARDRKQFSALELQRNLETVLMQAGAKRVFEGPLKRDIYYGPQLEDEIGGAFIDAVNMHADAPTQVFAIRQPDRNIWVQLSDDRSSAGLVVMEERPFVATSRWSGEFPHLTLPKGYAPRNAAIRRDFDMFPFWTGKGFEEVEGKIHAADFGAGEQNYSMHEVRRNLEAMMAEAGGKLVFSGRIPKEQAQGIGEAVKRSYGQAAGYSWDNFDSEVYRVDLPDGRELWVFARLEYMSAGWVVAERKALAQTAALLPAEALKKKLDSDGRVAIDVHFAVDKADILPDSQPQIAQVLALLKSDPGLKLAIEGHTDDSGTPAHNRSLSEARARSVQAALTSQGIAASRLSAAGFGQDRPVAANDSDAGRAKNRRVELVKR